MPKNKKGSESKNDDQTSTLIYETNVYILRVNKFIKQKNNFVVYPIFNLHLPDIYLVHYGNGYCLFRIYNFCLCSDCQ